MRCAIPLVGVMRLSSWFDAVIENLIPKPGNSRRCWISTPWKCWISTSRCWISTLKVLSGTLSYCVKHLRFWIYTEIVLIGMGIAKDFTVTWYSWRNRGLNMEICAFLFEISMFCWIFPLFPLFHEFFYVFSVEYSLDMLRCWLKVLVLVHEVMILSYKNIHIMVKHSLIIT